MSDILVSIVIPVYHSEGTLLSCLESINNQEFEGLEVIIIDSENSQDTAMLSKIQKARYFNIELNNIAAKRNFGATQSKGEIILFLDSDCLLPEHFFDSLEEIFQDTEIVAAGSHDFKLPTGSHWINYAWQIHFQVWSTHNTSWIPTRCLAVRKQTFQKINGFNDKLITCEDVDLGYRLNNYGRILNTDKLTITHLLNPTNLGQFFMKELWHGLNSISISIKNRSNWKEIVYLLIPTYFIGMVLLLCWSLFQLCYLGNSLGLLLLLLGLTPSIAMAFYTVYCNNQLKYFPGLAVAYQLYLFARGAAALRLHQLWKS